MHRILSLSTVSCLSVATEIDEFMAITTDIYNMNDARKSANDISQASR